jgi:hypothetical protein
MEKQMTKKPLSRIQNQLFHIKDGEKVAGPNPSLTGGCTGLFGDCTGLRGNLSEIPFEVRPCDIKDWIE